jgi:uncharacterized membrane protein
MDNPNLIEMMRSLGATKKCIENKCNAQSAKSKKNKYITELEKLKQDFTDKKIDFKTFYKKSNQIEIKIIKEKYRDELIECQLKNCYKETEHMVKIAINSFLIDSNKGKAIYKIASKYNKLFEKNKITVKSLNEYDIEIIKSMMNMKKQK